VGVGFYGAALSLAALTGSLMMWATWLEQWLPARPALAISLRFKPGVVPEQAMLAAEFRCWGYELAGGSISVHGGGDHVVWRFVIVSLGKGQCLLPTEVAGQLGQSAQVATFELSPARN
jgi:putative Mg2+ transporter-C (MgtC) family protein